MDKPTTNHYDMLPPERARKNRPFPDKENERRQDVYQMLVFWRENIEMICFYTYILLRYLVKERG